MRQLIFKIVRENPTWGAPRIRGELRMLGFDIPDKYISRKLGTTLAEKTHQARKNEEDLHGGPEPEAGDGFPAQSNT